jgi:hypothetical protein
LALVVAAIGAVVVCLAPGNEARIVHFPEAKQLDRTVLQCLLGAARAFAEWIVSPAVLAASGLVLVLAGAPQGLARLSCPGCSTEGNRGEDAASTSLASRQAASTSLRRRRIQILALAGYWAVFALAFAPALWATGFPPIERTRNALHLMFLLGWFATVGAVAQAVAPWTRRAVPPPTARWALRATALLFAFALATPSSNLHEAFYSLTRAPTFRRQRQAREAIVRRAAERGETFAELPAFVDPPWTIHVADLALEPNDWSNRAYARYRGLESVALVPAAAAPAPAPGRPE